MNNKAICLVPKNRKQLKIYLDEQHQLPPRLRKMALKKQREIYKIYYNKIKVLNNKGLVKNLDVDVMTFGIFAMINWSARWFKEKGKLSIEEIANQYIQIFFSGILKKEVVKEK